MTTTLALDYGTYDVPGDSARSGWRLRWGPPHLLDQGRVGKIRLRPLPRRGSRRGIAATLEADETAIFLTFVGTDEGVEISGAAGNVVYNAEDDTIIGPLRYHQGDDLPFVWKKVRPPSVATKPTKLSPARGKKRK